MLGDLNEGPPTGGSQAPNLAAALQQQQPACSTATRYTGSTWAAGPGTYDSCGLRNRLDYILLSTSLQQKFSGARCSARDSGASRKTRPDDWATYPDMTESVEQASDHAAVYVELNI